MDFPKEYFIRVGRGGNADRDKTVVEVLEVLDPRYNHHGTLDSSGVIHTRKVAEYHASPDGKNSEHHVGLSLDKIAEKLREEAKKKE